MGELAGPKGLTEGVWYDEWQQLKVTNVTPFAAIAALPPKGAARARSTTPKGGSKGLYEFALDFLNGILRTAADPSAALCAAPPLSGEIGAPPFLRGEKVLEVLYGTQQKL